VRTIGQGRFALRGVELQAMVAPYSLYMLQRITDAFGALAPGEQSRVHAYFSEHGLGDLLTLTAARRVLRQNHLEVWA
jgi:hypothetical protein